MSYYLSPDFYVSGDVIINADLKFWNMRVMQACYIKASPKETILIKQGINQCRHGLDGTRSPATVLSLCKATKALNLRLHVSTLHLYR